MEISLFPDLKTLLRQLLPRRCINSSAGLVSEVLSSVPLFPHICLTSFPDTTHRTVPVVTKVLERFHYSMKAGSSAQQGGQSVELLVHSWTPLFSSRSLILLFQHKVPAVWGSIKSKHKNWLATGCQPSPFLVASCRFGGRPAGRVSSR